MTVNSAEIAVVGGGIVGLATALSLLEAQPGLSLTVHEKEGRVAAHQTGHNSGVIHAGLYYSPGSMKAETCTAGREMLYRYCAANGIRHERCGKVVVAVRDDEMPALDELERRGRANGLDGLERLDAKQLACLEEHAAGVEALFVPQTGIVDFAEVAEAMAKDVRSRGGTVRLGSEIVAIRRAADGFVLETPAGSHFARHLVNCAGLHCDRVARLAGVDPDLRIVPFRGEYYEVVPERKDLVKNLIYPVPDPAMPFLGVHFTRMVDGVVEAGPNAVLALAREGYRRRDISPRDLAETLAWPGFWRLARRFWRTGIREYRRSFSKEAFVRDLRRLVPDLKPDDVRRGGAGVRAQAVGRDGRLLDDFRIISGEGMVHVLNAPSPAATASLAIGRKIADEAGKVFGLG